ncbi:MAG: sulfatase [Candidatus Sumerlaeia bacterium]|nr:sulfatase [Candidatus Sumerlaeia bacterium]
MHFTKRRFFLSAFQVVVILMTGGILALPTARAGAAQKPNIVFILIDDMGYRDVGCYGSRFYLTPNIDRLAEQGMRFTDAYAACPVCSPTRLSILTGLYPARVGLTNFLVGQRWPDNSPLRPFTNWKTEMPPEQVTLAEALKPLGYVSACIGKWHLNSRESGERSKATSPEAQGFDFVVASAPNQTDKQAAGFTDKAIEFIRANRDRPFFLYLCHHSVHIPLEARPELIEKYQKRVRPDDPQNNPTYAGMVEAVDESTGRIMAVLDELGLTANTIFVFTSDNGGLSVREGPNTPATSNLPLRAGKGYLYEGGIREPLIIRWPGVIASGSTCSVPVSSVDFYPTFLEIVGLTHQPVDGVSILPLLKQSGTLQREALFWHYPHYSNQGGLPSGAIRMGEYKLIESYEDGRLELYNLREDIGEQRNLADSMPEKAKAMRQKLDEWRKALGAQMPEKNPNYDPSKPPYSDPAKAPQAWQESEPKPKSKPAKRARK